MNLNELETAEGRLRFHLLQTMCRAIVSKSAWIGTLSNWALATTAGYVSLMIISIQIGQLGRTFRHRNTIPSLKKRLRLRIKRTTVGKPFEIENNTITPEDLEAEVELYKATRKELEDFFLRLFPEFRS
jgi:hypothetical protein